MRLGGLCSQEMSRRVSRKDAKLQSLTLKAFFLFFAFFAPLREQLS